MAKIRIQDTGASKQLDKRQGDFPGTYRYGNELLVFDSAFLLVNFLFCLAAELSDS